MSKLLLSALAISISTMSFADYMIKMPLETFNGGNLPNGSISFITAEAPVEPEILDCTGAGLSTECDNRLDAWSTFADANALPKDWNALRWEFKNLATVPSEAYPIATNAIIWLNWNKLTNVNGLNKLTSAVDLFLENNLLTDIYGLSNLQTVSGSFNLNNNKLTALTGLNNLNSAGGMNLSANLLTNVDGLSGLTRVDAVLQINNNKLTNLNGLANLTYAQSLYANGNLLTNIDGLSNLTVASRIRIDTSYAGPKLPANSIFCTANAPARFQAGYAQKTQLCSI